MARYDFEDSTTAENCARKICAAFAEQNLYRAFKPEGKPDSLGNREDFIFRASIKENPVVAFALDKTPGNASITFDFAPTSKLAIYQRITQNITQEYGGHRQRPTLHI